MDEGVQPSFARTGRVTGSLFYIISLVVQMDGWMEEDCSPNNAGWMDGLKQLCNVNSLVLVWSTDCVPVDQFMV